MAEQLFLMAIGNDADAARFWVTSAGTHACDGREMDPPAAKELRRLGGDATWFRSHALTDPACKKADLILTATREQRSIVLDRVPQALRRTFTILEFSQSLTATPALSAGNDPAALIAHVAAQRGNHRFENYDVSDPYAGTTDDHRRAADTIDGAVRTVASRLISSIQSAAVISAARPPR